MAGAREAGVGGDAVARLAALSRRVADIDVPILLPEVMSELGLAHHDRGSVEAKEEGLRAMAVRVLSGELTPRELTRWTHRVFCHEDEGWRLSELDDVYDSMDVSGQAEADVDAEVLAEVLAEVRRITS